MLHASLKTRYRALSLCSVWIDSVLTGEKSCRNEFTVSCCYDEYEFWIAAWQAHIHTQAHVPVCYVENSHDVKRNASCLLLLANCLHVLFSHLRQTTNMPHSGKYFWFFGVCSFHYWSLKTNHFLFCSDKSTLLLSLLFIPFFIYPCLCTFNSLEEVIEKKRNGKEKFAEMQTQVFDQKVK